MSQSLVAIRLVDESDPPSCTLPARLGPAKQSACFSVIKKRLAVDSTEALRFFVHPPPKISLRHGLREYLRQPRADLRFQRVKRLDYIFDMCLSSKNSEELLKAQVVTWRGIITKMIVGDKIDLSVSFYQGVLYLEEYDGRNWRLDQGNETTYQGHKFESCCTAASPGGVANLDRVDLNTFWAAGITRTLGSLNILLVGEVDSVTDAYLESPGPEHYVELKTRNWEAVVAGKSNKSRGKWDIQSHLVGARDIFVGYPDAHGIVRKYETTVVRDMEPMQSRIDWVARIFHRLREHCGAAGETSPLKVWRLEMRKKHVDVCELGPLEVKKLNNGGVPRNGIVPVSFIKALEARRGAGSG